MLKQFVSKGFIIAGFVMVVFTACDNDDSGTNSGRNWNSPGRYSVESEPTLSIDRQDIYFITEDTLVSEKNGIFRAVVDAPAREKVLEGYGFHSPVLFPDESAIAFLAGGTLNYLNLTTNTASLAGVQGNFDAIVFINDSLLVASAGSVLYLINQNDNSVSPLTAGTDPTYYGKEQIFCLSKEAPNSWDVHKITFSVGGEGIMFLKETPTSITAEGDVRWLSVEPVENRYVFVEQRDTANLVYTGQLGTSTRYFIAESGHVKALMISFNMLIYQGPDGRFYQSNFTGSTKIPFWYAEDFD